MESFATLFSNYFHILLSLSSFHNPEWAARKSASSFLWFAKRRRHMIYMAVVYDSRLILVFATPWQVLLYRCQCRLQPADVRLIGFAGV